MCAGKNIVYVGCGTVLGFRHPLGVLNVSPREKGGPLYLADKVKPVCTRKLALVVVVVVVIVMTISEST